MTKKTTVLFAILALVAGGMSMLAFEGSPVAYAAPRIQETESSRPTPTNEPQATEPPVQPTEPPIQPTEPPVQPTEPPVQPTEPPAQPTEKPNPTSKPKKPSKSSGSSAPTQVPPTPIPTTPAVSDSVPSTGFGSVGGWTLGVTGLILVCILVVARRLRIGNRNGKGRSGTAGESINHRHPQK